jgi:DNA-binding transcriptional regulator GbsR (MarR family)
MTIPTELRSYVDETGLLMEAGGLPRTAGQILGWMLVCEPEHQSLNNLTEVLGISKATASSITRFLVQVGFLERTIGAGARRDYYRVSRMAWSRFMKGRAQLMHNLRQNAEHGLCILADAPPQRRDRLERMHRLYSFLENELTSALERFEADESARSSPPASGVIGSQ